MSEELSAKVIRHHAELVADLLRLGIPDVRNNGYRQSEIRRMIRSLEGVYPELEYRRITLMEKLYE